MYDGARAGARSQKAPKHLPTWKAEVMELASTAIALVAQAFDVGDRNLFRPAGLRRVWRCSSEARARGGDGGDDLVLVLVGARADAKGDALGMPCSALK